MNGRAVQQQHSTPRPRGTGSGTAPRNLMASMQRSASSVGDAFTEAVASASRSVGAFGLEREIASYESKIRAQAPIRRPGPTGPCAPRTARR